MPTSWSCPACSSRLLETRQALVCHGCQASYPTEDGIADFRRQARASPLPTGGTTADAAYERFLQARSRRGQRDHYAAFQPFNESARTWRAFAALLREHLRDGDAILDLHNRTGWTGAELASESPRQRITSLWEGDRDVLGARGYRYWYGRGRAPANLAIAFADPAAPLPLSAGSQALVHGYDVLHHRDLEPFIAAVMRVLAPGGCALFPHVHTADAEPRPWFRRGGELRTTEDIQRTLDRLLGDGPHRAVILGEASLFRGMVSDSAPLLDGAGSTGDYNAFVAIVPRDWIGRRLATEPAPRA